MDSNLPPGKRTKFILPNHYQHTVYFVLQLAFMSNFSVLFRWTILGLNSYFSIVSMAGIRYLSVVRLERSWHTPSRNSFWSSRHVWKVWGIVLTIAVPPLFGFGEYKVDTSTIWYIKNEIQLFISANLILILNILFHSSCTPYWPASTLLGICYNWLLITKGFIIPTILILSSTCLVTKKLREVNQSLEIIKYGF